MSCFKGTVDEYPGISLDRFDGKNLLSTAFFLSHNHSDHTIGLDAPAFLANIEQSPYPIKLHCHEVTAGLLYSDQRFRHLKPHIEKMSCDSSTLIHVPGDPGYNIEVTLIPAAHCPGSVMFLISGHNGTILYTGDFRLHVGETQKIPALFERPISAVYVDTTFFTRRAFSMPSRAECLTEIVKLVQEWLDGDDSNVINIETPYLLGFEFLIMQLSQKFNRKIYIDCADYERYGYISSISDCLTTDMSETRIRFSKANCNDRHILKIVPSAMYFTAENIASEMVCWDIKRNAVRVCYSSHSSREEIVDFLRALKPAKIRANVLPKDEYQTLIEVNDALKFLEVSNLVSKPAADVTYTFRKRKYNELAFSPQKSPPQRVHAATSQDRRQSSGCSTNPIPTKQCSNTSPKNSLPSSPILFSDTDETTSPTTGISPTTVERKRNSDVPDSDPSFDDESCQSTILFSDTDETTNPTSGNLPPATTVDVERRRNSRVPDSLDILDQLINWCD